MKVLDVASGALADVCKSALQLHALREMLTVVFAQAVQYNTELSASFN